VNDFVKRSGNIPYYISSAFDKDWRRVWSPCASCAEKNLALSSFKNGICDLCEEEYKLGLFDQYRERKESYELPSVKCKLPKLPETRIAGEEPVEEEDPKDEAPSKESDVELSGKKVKTKKGATKTVMKAKATTTKKEPISKTKGASETTGEKESSSTAKTKAKTKTSKGSASAEATSVIEVSSSKTTKTVTSKSKPKKDD